MRATCCKKIKKKINIRLLPTIRKGKHHTDPLKHRDVLQVESDVKKRHEIVNEFKEQQFGNAIAFELRFRTMIF